MFCIPAGYFFAVLIVLIFGYLYTKSLTVMAIGALWTAYYVAEFMMPCTNYIPPDKPYWPTEHGLFELGKLPF